MSPYPFDQLSYSTRPDSRQVICDECGKNERYGCAECAEDYAERHRKEFGHEVAVVPPFREDFRPPRNIRQRRQWWER